MKKIITIAILLGIVWLGFAILFPNKNNSVKIKELNYASLFNDQNGVQLKSAAKFGIKQPLKNRDAADEVKDGLVRIRDNSHYTIAKLTHSIPYLRDGAAELLDMIGKNFLDCFRQQRVESKQDYRNFRFENTRGYKEAPEIR